jgi:hypothetical protein
MQARLELEHLLDLRLIDWRLDGRAGASAVGEPG